MLQQVFKESYTRFLMDNANVEDYRSDVFEVDPKNLASLCYMAPEGLASKLDPNDLLGSAIALYEAYRYPPVVVSDLNLWAFLSHVAHFDFVKKIVGEIPNGEKGKDFVVDKFVFNRKKGFMDMPLPNLYWSVQLTVCEELEDPYAYTRLLYSLGKARRYLLRSTVFRIKEAMFGILDFVNDNPDVFRTHCNSRVAYIVRILNDIGAYKKLSFLERDFFYNFLESRKEEIIAITNIHVVNGSNVFSSNDDEDDDGEFDF